MGFHPALSILNRQAQGYTPMQQRNTSELLFWAIVIAVWVFLFSVSEIESLKWIDSLAPVPGLTPARLSVALGVVSYWFVFLRNRR
jgi:hypothetical protein